MFANGKPNIYGLKNYTHSRCDNGCDLQGMDRRALMNAQYSTCEGMHGCTPTERSQVDHLKYIQQR